MNRIATFRQRLLAGEPLLGTFLKTPSAIVGEVLAQAPLDVVCIDAEHAPFGRLELDACVMALRAGDMPSLIRVPSGDPSQLLNALDLGATGVVVPHVLDAAQAEAVARTSRFGRGGRGYAGSTRAAGYGGKPMRSHLADSAAQTVVIAQIEDIEAVEQIEAIAAIDGIDCCFVGRIDLTVALGASTPDAPEVVAAVERVVTACGRAGRRSGMFVTQTAEAARWRKAGSTLFLLGSDHQFLLQGSRALREAFDATG